MQKNMSKEDFELFKILVQSSQEKLHKTLYKVLKRHYKNIINTSDYIMAQGDIPVALVAHMDTVFKIPPEVVYYDRQEGVLWSPDGLGADDRAGVFLILKIIQNVKKNKKPTVIFTTNEEFGCLGASALVNDIEKAPWDLKYIIQLDRHGIDDCVFYDDINVEFSEYVKGFGFKYDWGTLSDISVICPAWGISGVNLSVGYEDEHQEIETLHIKYTYMTLAKVLVMLDDINQAEYFKYKASPHSIKWWQYGHKFRSSVYDYPGWDDDDYYPFSEKVTGSNYCYHCHKSIDLTTAIKAKDEYGNYHYFCGKCAANHVHWCENCGAAFIDYFGSKTKYNKLCADCIDKTWEKGDPLNGNEV